MAQATQTRFGYVPHFDVTTVDGNHVRYQEIWQHRNLVLVAATPEQREAAIAYAAELTGSWRDFDGAETTVVVTTDRVPELGPPRVVIADRWGEILHIESPSGGAAPSFPSVEDVQSWVDFARIQCPECPP